MEGAEVLRAVRRRQGWSQRELADRAGVHPRTVAAIEAGARAATVAVLDKVLGCAGLALSVDAPPPALDEAVRAHLRRSLSWRLHRVTGGIGRPHRGGPPNPVWDQLLTLAGRGDVVLHGAVARAIWLPPEEPLRQIEVCGQPRPGATWPHTSDIEVRHRCAEHAAALVAVSVESWLVGVDPPADLAVHPGHAADRPRLRAVARLLHEQAARDMAGRRVRAHADPAHLAERAYVFHSKRYGQRPMPDDGNRRGWRLDDTASLGAWLGLYGYPS